MIHGRLAFSVLSVYSAQSGGRGFWFLRTNMLRAVAPFGMKGHRRYRRQGAAVLTRHRLRSSKGNTARVETKRGVGGGRGQGRGVNNTAVEVFRLFRCTRWWWWWWRSHTVESYHSVRNIRNRWTLTLKQNVAYIYGHRTVVHPYFGNETT